MKRYVHWHDRNDDDEQNIYDIARYVHMPASRVGPFLRVLEMCGYEIRRKDSGRPTAEAARPVTELTACQTARGHAQE